jgi:hypothetical protein
MIRQASGSAVQDTDTTCSGSSIEVIAVFVNAIASIWIRRIRPSAVSLPSTQFSILDSRIFHSASYLHQAYSTFRHDIDDIIAEGVIDVIA